MESGDGWLLRVQPRRSMLSAADARVLAGAAARHGNGIIELTNRGNLQLRGMTQASAELFASDILAAGLAGERTRHNLLVSPLAGVDPGVHPQTGAIADRLEAALADAADLHELPGKFLFLVDGGGAAGLSGIRADIAVRANGGQWAIRIDGESPGAICDPASLPDAVLRLARAFMANAGDARRMRDRVRSAGSHCLFQAANLDADLPPRAEVASDPIGFLPLRGDQGGFGLGIPFGHMDADRLRSLAVLSERFGDAILRITPWRSVVIAGVAVANGAALREAASGWITDPEDPRRRVVACIGRPRCSSATVDARADAAFLTATQWQGPVHVSGCAKGCAHPGSAAFTLVGNNGAYDIVRHGRASDPPDETGLTMAQAVHVLTSAP